MRFGSDARVNAAKSLEAPASGKSLYAKALRAIRKDDRNGQKVVVMLTKAVDEGDARAAYARARALLQMAAQARLPEAIFDLAIMLRQLAHLDDTSMRRYVVTKQPSLKSVVVMHKVSAFQETAGSPTSGSIVPKNSGPIKPKKTRLKLRFSIANAARLIVPSVQAVVDSNQKGAEGPMTLVHALIPRNPRG